MATPESAALAVPDASARPRAIHPVAYLLMILPFGASSGYISVTLGYQLSHAGADTAAIGALIALTFVPQSWKFLWAPLTDATLTRRTWFLIGALITCATFTTCATIRIDASALPVLTVLMVAQSAATTLMAMAVEALVVHNTPVDQRGRTSAWFQAGNLGGNGIGGGVGLWMAQRLPGPWMAGAVLAAACLLCAVALRWVAEPRTTIRAPRVATTLLNVLKDLWGVSKSRLGFLALFLCFLPIGSGAASNLWSAVAKDWRASADTVALVTGVMGGVVSAVGCLVGGWICDRMDRKVAYVVYGLLQAGCAVGMAFSPRTEPMYIVWTTLYALITGLTYAGFTAFVLEAMGEGAAATKFSLYASLSNFPIWYMTLIDGKAHTRWGPSGMLYAEAVVGVIGLVLFLAFLWGVQRLWPAHWPQRVEELMPATPTGVIAATADPPDLPTRS